MGAWLPIIRRRGVSVLFQSYINQGYRDAYYAEILGVPNGLGSHRYVNGWVIIHTKDAEEFTSKFIPRLDEPIYVDYFLRTCAHVSDELMALGAGLRTKDYAATQPSELLFDFMQFSARSIRVMPFLNTMVFVQDAIEERVLARLGRHYGLDIDDPDLRGRMQHLMAEGAQAPLASQAMADLGRLAREVVATDPILAERLQTDPATVRQSDLSDELRDASARYLEAYDFLGTNYYLGKPMEVDDLLAQIGGVLAKDSEGDVDGAHPSVTELSPDDRVLMHTAQRLQYLREYRLEALYKAGRDCRGLLTRIGESLGTSYEETVSLTFSEIQQSLTSGDLVVALSTMKARMAGYASCVEEGKEEFLVGESLERLLEELPSEAPKGATLSGVTAYPGECVGPARIVVDLAQADHVRAGDVLVAPMTMPYHVPAMARSAAVITDEGGILSHAAIVARELRIPCVVGLESATAVLRDGEMVRVDAAPSGGTVERVAPS